MMKRLQKRPRQNVGLTFNVNIDFVKNPSPDNSLVTKAIVSSVTSLDITCSLPSAAEYSTNSGKTAPVVLRHISQASKNFASLRTLP